MDISQFEFEITKLKSHFGDKSFSNEFTKIIWRHFQKYEIKDFKNLVIELISNRHHNKSPILDDFFKEFSKYGTSQTGQELEGCGYCDHLGLIFTQNLDAQMMAWSCGKCDLGKSQIKKIQNFKHAEYHGYYKKEQNPIHSVLKNKYGSLQNMQNLMDKKEINKRDIQGF